MPARKTRRPKTPPAPDAVRIGWEGFRSMTDERGRPLKRFYQLETLASGIERLLQGYDRFCWPSIQSVLGQSRPAVINFTFWYEDSYRFVFRMSAANMRRRRGVFALVVSKNDAECRTLLQAEYGHLDWLGARCHELVNAPYRGGSVFLPERRSLEKTGRSREREVFAYVAPWPGAYASLGVGAGGQFILRGETPKLLSLGDTELLKRDIIRLAACGFDPAARRGIDLDSLLPEDFGLVRTTGKWRLKLVACRRLRPRLNPSELVHTLLGCQWRRDRAVVALAPLEASDFLKSLRAAVGKETARHWLEHYFDALNKGKWHAHDTAYVDALREIMLK